MQNKNLLSVIKKIQKKLGNESIKILTENDNSTYHGISTGLIGIDNILGTKGLIFGRIYELFGNESSGKTTLALHFIKSFQDNQQVCAYIDAEHSLEPMYCKKLNINTNKLIIAQPNSGENAFLLIEEMLKTNEINLIIVDSVAALTPESEIKQDIADNSIGLQSRLMSKGLRKISSLLANSKCVLIFINQLRANINTFFATNSEITPGGKALKFYSSVRIELKKFQNIYKSNNVIGTNVKIKIIKNKLNIPYKNKILQLIYGEGFDIDNDLIETLIIKNTIVQKGAYYYFENTKLAQGKDNLIKKIKSDNNLHKQILQYSKK